MSSFTTQVRYICEEAAGLEGSVGQLSVRNSNVDNIIDLAIPYIFNFNYPIFDEEVFL